MKNQRKPVIAGNWKLNKTINEATQLVTMLKRLIPDTQQVDVVVCPVYTALACVAEILIDSTRFRPADQTRAWGSHEKLTQHTGWQPEVPLDETLSGLFHYWKNKIG